MRRQFKKIEQAALQPSFNKTIVSELKKALAKKYDALKEVSYLNYGSYLLSVQNFEENDFDELAQNFKKAETLPVVEPDKDLSYDEVLIDLAKQYENLTQKEKNALDLVNTDYYKLIKIIVSIKDYASLSIDDLLSFLNITDGFAALKISCYDNIKLMLEDSNDSLGTNILEDIAFNSAEDFIASILLIIETLKKIDLKIVGPIRGYFETLKYDNLLDEELVVLSSNVNSLISGVKQKENRIVLVDLEVDTPVLYSPNVLIIPDADSTTKIISYRKTTNTELILDLSRYKIKRANSSTVVSRYYSDLTKSDGKTIVSNLNLVNKNIFVEVDLKEKK